MKKVFFSLYRRCVQAKRRLWPLVPLVEHVARCPRIVIIRSDHLGDVVLSLDAIYSIREHFPEARIWVMAHRAYTPVLQLVPGLEGIIPFHVGMSRWQTLKAWWALKKIAPAVTIDLCHGNTLRAALVAWAARVPRRIGYRVGTHDMLYTDVTEIDGARTYEKEVALTIAVRMLGVKALNYVPYNIDAQVQQRFGASVAEPLVGFNLGVSALNPLKAWDIEKFRELMWLIYQRYQVKMVLTGTKDDLVLYDKIKDRLPPSVFSIIGTTSVEELMLWLKRCTCFISNNTGSMQLSVFLGTPTIVINGPSSIVRWAPRALQHRVVSKHLPCSALDCDGALCDKNFACIKDISVQEVLAAFEDVWQHVPAR